MAKPRDDFDFDDFETDNFNFDAEFGGGMEMKDDRSPVTKVSTEFLSGVKDSVITPSALRQTLKKALPKGYGQAWTTYDTIAGEGASLYHELAKDLKPAIRDFKRAAKGAKPLFDPLLPKSISEKLDRLLEDKDSGSAAQLSPDEMQNAAIQNELGAIFQHQQAAEESRTAEAAVKEASDRTRHQESTGIMDSIARSTGRLASYQDTVGIAFQRKSLELQYRQYFIAKDHFTRFGAYTEEVSTQLRAIAKNTGLPEAIKVQNNELMSQVFKERLFGQLHENLSQNAAAYLRKWIRQGGDRIRQSASDFRDSLSNATMGLEQVTMMAELQKDLPGGGSGFTEMGANMAGSSLGGWLGDRLGGFLRKQMEKSPKMMRKSNELAYVFDNIPGLADRWASDPWGQEPEWMRYVPPFIKNFLRDTIPQLTTGSVVQDRIQDATQPTQWDQYSRKTLVEIIPGYLARILQSSERHRLGTEEVPLLMFDYSKSKFSAAGSIAKDLYKQLAGKGDLSRADEVSAKLLEVLDPDNQLTNSQRAALQIELIKRAQDPRKAAFVAKDFTEGWINELSYSDNEAIRSLFSERLGDKEDSSKSVQYKMASLYSELAKAQPQMLEQINLLSQTGYRDVLRNLGVLKLNGSQDSVNEDYFINKYQDYIGTGSDYDNYVNQKSFGGDRVPSVGGAGRDRMFNNYSDLSSYKPTYTTAEVAPTFDSEGLNEYADRLAREIQTASSKAEAADAAATLREILALLQNGNFGSGGGATGEGPNGGAPLPGWLGRSTRWLGKGARGAISKLWNFGGGARNALWGGIKKFGSGIATGYRWMRGKAEAADVFVKGEATPRLEKALMAAGRYRDAVTGAVIQSYKDIKGTIIDINNPDAPVLTAEEIKNRGIFDLRGNELLKGKFKWVKDKFSWVLDQAKKGIGAPFKAFSWGRRKFKELTVKDVYVPGESKPRLYATLLMEGRYYLKSTRKPIFSVNDIREDVVNEQNQMVLPFELFAQGVVDEEGKPIKTTGAKLKGLIKGVKDFGVKTWGFAKDQFLKGFELLSGFGSRIGNWLSGKAGSGGFSFGGSNRQTEVLVRIHNLLCRHFGYEDTITPGDLQSSAGNFFKEAKTTVKSWWKRRPTKEELKARKDAVLEEAEIKFESLKEQAKLKRDEFLDNPEVIKAKAFAELQLEATKAKMRARLGIEPDQPIFKTLTDRLGKLIGRAMGKDESEMDDKVSIMERIKRKAQEWREGSLQDILQERAARKAKADDFVGPRRPEKADEKQGILSKILVAVLGAGATLKGMFGQLKDVIFGLGSVRKAVLATEAAKAGIDLAGGLGGPDLPDGPDGKGGKDGKPEKKKGLFRRGVGALGRGLWKAGGWVGRIGLGLGGAALAATGLTLGAVGAATATVAGGILSVLTSPITLTAGAIAAAGYTGYKGYQYFKGEAGELERLRMAQYGIDPNVNWQCKKLFDFEAGLLEYVSIQGTQASISDKVDWAQWFEHFEVNTERKSDLQAWMTWFNLRFKPVFLQWVSVLKAVSPNADFAKMDSDVDDGLKVQLARRTMFRRGDLTPFPYDVAPAWGEWSFQQGTATIDYELREIVVEYKDETPIQQGVVVKDGKVQSTVAGNTTGYAKAEKPTVGNVSKFVATSERAGAPLDPKKAIVSPSLFGSQAMIDDFTALRLKTYGLSELSVPRVNAILALEREALLDVVMGSGGVAEFKVSAEAYFREFAAHFEMSSNNAEHQELWRVWFLNRFIPILLNYVTAVRRIDKAINMNLVGKTLKPSDLATVAESIRSTKTKVGDQVLSVWAVNASPFPGMPINLDSNSVQRYAESIRNRASSDRYSEPVLKQKSPTFQTTGKDGKTIFNKLPDVGGPQIFQSDAMRRQQDPAKYKDLVSSSPTLVAGTGSGSYLDVPKPKGDGSWEALKDTITKAAEVVGVDPSFLATMAKIESGFRTTVKAKTSSATGLFQFIRKTWAGMINKYATQYGIPMDAQPTDPVASSILAGAYIKDNQAYLERKLGRGINANDLYAAHFLGPGGAYKLLSAPPDQPADALLPDAAVSNTPVFYKAGQPRSVAEIYEWINRKLSGNQVIPRSDEEETLTAQKQSKSDGLGGDTEVANSRQTTAPTKPSATTAPKLNSAYQQQLAKATTTTPVTSSAKVTDAKGKVQQEQAVAKAVSAQDTSQRQLAATQAKLAKANNDVQGKQVELLSSSVDAQQTMTGHLIEIRDAINDLAKALPKSMQVAQQPTKVQEPGVARKTLVDAPRPAVSVSRTV